MEQTVAMVKFLWQRIIRRKTIDGMDCNGSLIVL
jgi:hypothetical protein